MADSEQVKAALTALADGEDGIETGATTNSYPTADGGPDDYRAVIEQAVTATADIDAAAEFVESVGLERLEAAIEHAEHEVSGVAAEGREALAAFEAFEVAADGDSDQ